MEHLGYAAAGQQHHAVSTPEPVGPVPLAGTVDSRRSTPPDAADLGPSFERRRRAAAESEAQARLVQIARMDRTLAVGALSASLAHELNQPLGAILSNTETAEMMLSSDHPDLAAIKEILAEF